MYNNCCNACADLPKLCKHREAQCGAWSFQPLLLLLKKWEWESTYQKSLGLWFSTPTLGENADKPICNLHEMPINPIAKSQQ